MEQQRCIDCKHLKIDIDEVTNAEARCGALIGKRGKGKIITWACTTYFSREDAMLRRNPNYGEDRVKEILRAKKKPPRCCPLLISEEESK